MNKTRKLAAGSVFVAFGVILPIVFHALGPMGKVFLPMHIPVLIAGLFLGGSAGLLVGVITVILSSFLTGMPPVLPTLPIMAVELAVYGAIGGYLYTKRGWHLLVSLLVAMIIGRCAAAVAVYGMVSMLHISLKPVTYLTGAIVTGLPGIAVQLMLVPILVKRLESRYPKNRMLEMM